MLKHGIIFFIIFLGAFLIAPIYVTTYVGGIELGIEHSWKFFGGFMLLYYTFYNLFGQLVSPYGYPSYFGELNFLPNFIFLLFISLLCARLLTLLFIRTYKLNVANIFGSTSYLKKSVKHVTTTTIIGMVIVILLGAVGYFVFVKKSAPILQQPTPTSTQTNTPISPTPKAETTNWISFNSVKDTGIKPDFTFKHPSNWIQKGSFDGGTGSYIPFYEKDKYSQKCDEQVNGATTCHVTGQVAGTLVSGSSMAPAKVEYDSEIRETLTIDGYQGTKITGYIKLGVEPNAYIGKPGQKEMRVIVPNVNGIHFEFTMLIENKADEMIFNEILKTIVFNF